jgi:predicted RNA binding protein YcfA (HicA-like mRNA interferase family)
MPKVETNARKIIARLFADGWQNIGGGRHDRFVHDSKPGQMITVPRHRELTPGTARSIAKAAEWHGQDMV